MMTFSLHLTNLIVSSIKSIKANQKPAKPNAKLENTLQICIGMVFYFAHHHSGPVKVNALYFFIEHTGLLLLFARNLHGNETSGLSFPVYFLSVFKSFQFKLKCDRSVSFFT